MKAYLFSAIIIIVLISIAVFVSTKKKETADTSKNSKISKFQETKTDLQNGVEVVVMPKQIEKGKPAEFEVSFTAHEGDLAFDLVKISVLKFDGKEFTAESWDGGSGGHHLSGNLVFPGLEKEPTKMILKMENI